MVKGGFTLALFALQGVKTGCSPPSPHALFLLGPGVALRPSGHRPAQPPNVLVSGLALQSLVTLAQDYVVCSRFS